MKQLALFAQSIGEYEYYGEFNIKSTKIKVSQKSAILLQQDGILYVLDMDQFIIINPKEKR